MAITLEYSTDKSTPQTAVNGSLAIKIESAAHDRLLVVCLSTNNTSGNCLSSAVYRGLPLTIAQNSVGTAIAYLENPPFEGNTFHTIALVMSGSYTYSAAAYVFSKVDQSTPKKASGTATGATGNVTGATIAVDADTYMVDAVVQNAGTTLAADSPQTEVLNQTSGGYIFGSSYQAITAGGTENMSWTKTGSDGTWYSTNLSITEGANAPKVVLG
jgi:hypothetical protein